MPKQWTLLEVINATRSEIGEAPDSYVTRDEIVRWINMGLHDFCSRTRLLRTSATSNSVGGQKKYAVPPDFGIVEKVFYDGDELEPLDDHELLFDLKQSNLDQPGTPENYYMRGTSGSVVALFLHPVPPGIAVIEMWYVSIPDEVAADDKIITTIIPQEYISAVIHYAAERGRMKQRMLADAKAQRAFYEEQVMRAQAMRGQWQLDRPQFVKDELTWSNKATRRTW